MCGYSGWDACCHLLSVVVVAHTSYRCTYGCGTPPERIGILAKNYRHASLPAQSALHNNKKVFRLYWYDEPYALHAIALPTSYIASAVQPMASVTTTTHTLYTYRQPPPVQNCICNLHLKQNVRCFSY